MTTPTLPEIPADIRVITAERVCAAVETTLRRYLPAWAAATGLDTITDYQQLPEATAISSANLPVVAVACPGLAGAPTMTRRPMQLPRYDAAFRVNIAIYDRGEDHRQSAARARTWAALLRTVLTRQRHLGGLATDLIWVDEAYSLGSTATGDVVRTLGGCQVSVDVYVDDVVPAGAAPLPPEGQAGDPTAPLVRQVTSTVTAARP